MLTKKELKFLKELNKQDIHFMVVGLSAAILQGAPAVTQDVDLWFEDLSDPEIAQAIKRAGGFYVAPIPTVQNPPRFAGEDFEFLDIVTGMTGLGEFRSEFKKAKTVTVEGVKLKILPLERIIKSKKATDRPKDRAVLPALMAALKTIKSQKKK